jgi:hypothetical protein
MKLAVLLDFIAIYSSVAFTSLDRSTLFDSRNLSLLQKSDDVNEGTPEDSSKVCLVTGSSRGKHITHFYYVVSIKSTLCYNALFRHWKVHCT